MESHIADVSYRGNDPGATKYGNFINYYEFHKPVTRIKALPSNVWCTETQNNFVCLDIGCNSGVSCFSMIKVNENTNIWCIEFR